MSTDAVLVPLLDMVGYEALIDLCDRHGVLDAEGDVVEIGTFLGGGAAKLAAHLMAHHPGKRLQVIDVFDPSCDVTAHTGGVTMRGIYAGILDQLASAGALSDQEAVYRAATAPYAAVIDTHVGDSRDVADLGGPVAFGFIDGHHSPEAARHDFGLVWSRLSPGGACAFHDYGGDLPDLTAAIDGLIAEHADDIAAIEVDRARLLCFIVRRA